jgi:hypothetical protein
MATPVLLPSTATPAVTSVVTKAGAWLPGEIIPQMQNAFQMDYRTDITLTSAQILALQTTPVTIIPAPGPGLMLCPETVIMRMIGGTQYTDAGGAVSFSVGTMSAALAANTIITGPSGAGSRSQQIFAFVGTSTAASPPTNENAAMTISKATNNFAAGTGTLHITVFYTVETTT